MSKIKLVDVFKINGVPTYTFVEPKRYREILVSLQTPGRCLVIEGPSGIGKSTAIQKALDNAGLSGKITKLSARDPSDVEYINMLPKMKSIGIVLIDDFHRLDDKEKSNLADYLKILADKEDNNSKIIILGINSAGENLIQFSPDLVNRVDIIRFESEPDEKISELLSKGEKELNISINVSKEIIEAVKGSFYLAQMLAMETCTAANILEQAENMTTLSISFESIKANVWDRLGRVYRKRCEDFCRGSKLNKSGRAPYLHILNWIATGDSWTLDLRKQIRNHPELRGSVSQVVDKSFLYDLINNHSDIRKVMHYDKHSALLTIEDPQFLFYIRNISWRQFARDIGFVSIEFKRRYDFALSFAGTDRDIANMFFNKLLENDVEIFYDKNEQHRILAEDVEQYLLPIYQTEAQFIIILLSKDYPKRIWTKIESDAFKQRFIDGSVIPIWLDDTGHSLFDESQKRGGITLDKNNDINMEVNLAVDVLLKKLNISRDESSDE